MNFDAFADFAQTYGPTLVRTGLLLMAAYHLWNRNVLKGAVSLTACMVTFVLGW